ncbi:rhombosortase [Rheinheimera sp. WS51]|uniref:rhombosortase n=1 Tax=Rheinheimera sp. WS51 TaxID=3425886 RepID=UPI003D91E961
MLPNTLLDWLTYDRAALDAFQWWRLLTGQFIHLRLHHLLLNLAGLSVAWLLFAENLAGFRYLWLLPIIALSCSTGMLFFAPEINYYIGFSGVLYGIFTWGAAQDVMQQKTFSRLILMAIIAKATYEFFIGPLQITAINANPLATAAHFFGVASALCIACCHYLFGRIFNRNT